MERLDCADWRGYWDDVVVCFAFRYLTVLLSSQRFPVVTLESFSLDVYRRCLVFLQIIWSFHIFALFEVKSNE